MASMIKKYLVQSHGYVILRHLAFIKQVTSPRRKSGRLRGNVEKCGGARGRKQHGVSCWRLRAPAHTHFFLFVCIQNMFTMMLNNFTKSAHLFVFVLNQPYIAQDT